MKIGLMDNYRIVISMSQSKTKSINYHSISIAIRVKSVMNVGLLPMPD